MGTDRIEIDVAIAEASAAEVRAAIGDCPDLTLVRGPAADDDDDDGGLHSLLTDRRYREVRLDQLACVNGKTVLLDARNGLDEWTPRALAIAERRFEHVIVLLPRSAGVPEKARGHRATHPRVTIVDVESVDAETEFLMLVDPGAEPPSAAIERLAAELDAHSDALGVAARVVDASGVTLAHGGELREWDQVVEFRPAAAESAVLPTTCDWVAGHGLMVRASALKPLPLDPTMGADTFREWSYRASRLRARPFRYCPDAVVITTGSVLEAPPRAGLDSDFRTRCRALAPLETAARFHARHGLVLNAAFEILPTLTTPGTAATLLTLLHDLGGDRFLELWAGGHLDPLLVDDTARHADELAALDGRS